MKQIITLIAFSFLSLQSNAQNVGIGTTIPLMKLHVSKPDSAVALFENTQLLNTNISNALYFKTGSGIYPYTGAVKTIGQSTGSARLGLFTYASANANGLLERMSITDDGKVGINTINPLMQLHIKNASSNNLLLENTQTLNANISNSMYFKIGNGSYPYTGAIKSIGQDSTNARLSFYTYASANSSGLLERMTITDNGNIGVGTITPNAKLDINGSIAVSGAVTLPIKVVTSNYTLLSNDYTIVVDMQNDSSKLVNIYVPPVVTNSGRVIKIVAINMKPFYTNPSNHGMVKIFDDAGSVLYEKLYYSYVQDNAYNSNIGAWQTDFIVDKQSNITLQCAGTAGWVITDMTANYDRSQFTN